MFTSLFIMIFVIDDDNVHQDSQQDDDDDVDRKEDGGGAGWSIAREERSCCRMELIYHTDNISVELRRILVMLIIFYDDELLFWQNAQF